MTPNQTSMTPALTSVSFDTLLILVGFLPFSSVYRLSLTCKQVYNAIKTFKHVYSRKVLSAFGLRVSRLEGRTVEWNGIPWRVGQPSATLSYRHDMKWLTELHVGSWRAGNVACVTACDDGFLARIHATGPEPADGNARVIRICSITAASYGAGTHHTSGWVLLVECARPLEIAICADVDMIAVLCARNETNDNPGILEVQCYRLSAHAFHIGPFRTISLSGLRFDPRSVPPDRLRCRLLINGEMISVFVADILHFDKAFLSVLAWSRVDWGEVVLRPRGRSHDVAWLSHNTLGVLSDEDGLETHEVTHVWPLTVEKRANFLLPISRTMDTLTLSASVCAIRPTRRFDGRRSFYTSWRACEHLLRVPREATRMGKGIVVIAASEPGSNAGGGNGCTLVVTVSYIMALALSGQSISWETWNAQVRVIPNIGQGFRGRVAGMTTAEWRDTNDVRFREGQLREDAALSVQESPTGKCLVLTHYDTAADVSLPPVVLDSGTTSSAVERQRERLVRSTRRSDVRAVLRQNVSTIMQLGGYALHDDMSNALVCREDIFLPDQDYTHMLLDRGRLWMAGAVEPTSMMMWWDIYAIPGAWDDTDEQDSDDGAGTEGSEKGTEDEDDMNDSNESNHNASDEGNENPDH